jgi:hypothetical protein
MGSPMSQITTLLALKTLDDVLYRCVGLDLSERRGACPQ